MLTCDAGGVHSVDFRALNGGISGILCGDDESAIIVLLSEVEAAAGIALGPDAEVLWLLLRFRNGGISGIRIGCDPA